jgi:hypothetical protein
VVSYCVLSRGACCAVGVLQEKWEEGYYITAMAGSMSSASLVVMSKGTPYTQQSYKVCSSAKGCSRPGFGEAVLTFPHARDCRAQ